ncbi:MAG TPA: type II toxin-antitoxin system PemK/MazF family toxin [Gammaproteobacteria bacterium]|jgi:mRNA interferase ChpB|nr:type II toxin-antitoxin system PemK/MazF family toxin [Gammaproteobacteria bacterium]
MMKVPERGDIYHIDPDPKESRDAKGRERFIVVTRSEINRLGVAITVPVSTSTSFAKATGLTVAIHGYDTTGVAICNKVRSFDIENRVRQGSARFIESLDDSLMREIINRVVSVIDPA